MNDDAPPPLCHTFVVSDIHLSDSQPLEPRRPLWKRYKGRDLFIDDAFSRFLVAARELAGADENAGAVGPPIELVLNGDIFDFDSVMAMPSDPAFDINWLERRRGLDPEEPKSVYKMSVILAEHPVFVEALRSFLNDGHRVVFVIGNHDAELNWPSVQAKIRSAILPEGESGDLRFCEWFYLSERDTLIEHGHQYDSYCVCPNPVHPLIHVRGHDRVRLPFGNLAGKYMLNGMGLFNPHVESTFIRPAWGYAKFFVRYVIRTQPLLVWSWFWSAMATLVVSLHEGFLPALRDPFSLEERVDGIAERANVAPRIVRGMQTMHVHPAVFNPLSILRELWLDRAILFAMLILGTFQLFSFLNVLVNISLWWWGLLFALFMPPFVFYARTVNSNVNKYATGLRQYVAKTARLTHVKRAIMGHTHEECHRDIAGVEFLNTGTWSPAYEDVACTAPFGRKCFAWLRPTDHGRVAELREWQDPGSVVIPPEDVPAPATSLIGRMQNFTSKKTTRPDSTNSGPS